MSSLYGAVEQRTITSIGEQWLSVYRAARRRVTTREEFHELANELTYHMKLQMEAEPHAVFRIQVYKAPGVSETLKSLTP